MCLDKKICDLYDALLERNIVTIKDIVSCGFKLSEVNNLIKDEKIKRVNIGRYSLGVCADLFQYGEYLFKNQDCEKASICFKKDLEFNPDHLESVNCLFFDCIKYSKYKSALNYLDVLINSSDSSYVLLGNYYLLLLSSIIDLPKRYYDYLENLNGDDFSTGLENIDFKDSLQIAEKIKLMSLQKKYKVALDYFNGIFNKIRGKLTISNRIVQVLLRKSLKRQNAVKTHIRELALNKKYVELEAYLENMRDNNYFTKSDECTLMIVKDLLAIKSGVRLEREELRVGGIIGAIKSKNYEIALGISEDYLKKNCIKRGTNVNNILLKEINMLIHDIRVLSDQQSELNLTPNAKTSELSLYFMRDDFDGAFKILKEYLNFNGKEEYEDLLIDLIKISMLEGDYPLNKVRRALSCIITGDAELPLNEYLVSFNKSIEKKRFDIAKLYLDIIARIDSALVTDLEESFGEGSDEKDIIKRIDISVKKTEALYKVRGKLFDLYERGLVVLDELDEVQCNNVLEVTKDMEDIESFRISGDKVALRIKRKEVERIKFGKVLAAGSKAFDEGDYDKCLDCYKKVLEFGELKIFIIAKIGLCYYKKNDFIGAIDYLSVATELSESEEDKYDYKELIDMLKREVTEPSANPLKKVLV